MGTTNFTNVTAETITATTAFVGNLTGNATGTAGGTFTGIVGGTFTGQSAGTFTGQGAGTFTGQAGGTFTGPVTGDITGVLIGTPQSVTTAGTITNAAAMTIIDSTTARAITWTNPTKIGATYRVFCITAPSSGTHSVTLASAGTFHWQGTAGSIIQFSLAYQAVTVNVISAGNFVLTDNVGTVTLA